MGGPHGSLYFVGSLMAIWRLSSPIIVSLEQSTGVLGTEAEPGVTEIAGIVSRRAPYRGHVQRLLDVVPRRNSPYAPVPGGLAGASIPVTTKGQVRGRAGVA